MKKKDLIGKVVPVYESPMTGEGLNGEAIIVKVRTAVPVVFQSGAVFEARVKMLDDKADKHTVVRVIRLDDVKLKGFTEPIEREKAVNLLRHDRAVELANEEYSSNLCDECQTDEDGDEIENAICRCFVEVYWADCVDEETGEFSVPEEWQTFQLEH